MSSQHENPYGPDLPNQPWSAKCVCGQRFMQPNSYALHVGCCSQFKSRLRKNLQKAKDARRSSTATSTANKAPLPEAAQSNTPTPDHAGRFPKKRGPPAWMSQGNLDVDTFRTHGTPQVATEETVVPAAQGPLGASLGHSSSLANAVDEAENPETLGRGKRKKTLVYKICAAANVEPSSTNSLPVSQFQSVILEHEKSILEAKKASLAPVCHPVPAPNMPPSELPQSRTLKTRPNGFGLYKSYLLYSDDYPHDPDSSSVPSDFREDLGGPAELQVGTPQDPNKLSLHPFPNLSSFRLGEWFWSDDHEKSLESFKNLLGIVGSDNFSPADVREANWNYIHRALAVSQYEEHDVAAAGQELEDGISWATTSITINVPVSKSSQYPGSYPFTVPGFHYRPLVPVIKDRLQSATQQEHFHTLGCELRWKPGPGKEDVRVYGEMYHSPAFIEAYNALQATPPEPNCTRPRHIVGLMFASDATMLAAFGSAKLWPLYMFFSNDSKYKRAKPSEKLFETIAYFEKLPDSFKEFVGEYTGKAALNPTLLTHCQRELFHEQWKRLLDPDFVEAYIHGIVVSCYDGRERRFYPRIFTYSADYPEKILIASIKNLGACPCPRCKITMADVPAMGKAKDRNTRVRLARKDDEERRKRVDDARNYLYKTHLSFASNVVEARLNDGSLVPSDNAFSARLASHGFNLFQMLVVDVMHEVELGVWKAIFIQLLRLLEAAQRGTANILDARPVFSSYRSMPTFGRDTIRRFINNVSEMKQLAARDWEDLLQCAIPAFEGLLPPPHNDRAMKLLFTFGRWHGFAKLRMHTDHTLKILDGLTTQLGDDIRTFMNKTCSKIETKELPREYQARKRREARRKQGKPSTTVDTHQPGDLGVPSGQQVQSSTLPTTAGPDPGHRVLPPPSTQVPLVSTIPSSAPMTATKNTSDSGGRPSLPTAPVARNRGPLILEHERVELLSNPGGAAPSAPAAKSVDKGGSSVGVLNRGEENCPSTASSYPVPQRSAVSLGKQPAHKVLSVPAEKQALPRGQKRKADSGRQPTRASKRLKDAQREAQKPSGSKSAETQERPSIGSSAPSEAPPTKNKQTPVASAASETTGAKRKRSTLDTPFSQENTAVGTADGQDDGDKRRPDKKSRRERPAAVSKCQKALKDTPQAVEVAVTGADTREDDDMGDGRRAKTLNLNTYKFHALGDVVPTIRLFGTTDSYSTQIPERFHRYPKMHYKRTNKKNVSRQLSRIQARQARIRRLRKQLVMDAKEGYLEDQAQSKPYFIGKSENTPINLPAYLQGKMNDPVTRSFIPKLKDHLLPRIYHRLLEEEEKGEKDERRLEVLRASISNLKSTSTAVNNGPTDPPSGPCLTLPRPDIPDVDRIYIHSDRIYQHNILHINYTSYDVRRETDIINPNTTRRDIMCLRLTEEDETGDTSNVHRFVHARVLGIYHVNVVYRGTGAVDLRKRRFDFLWVRWYSFCDDIPSADSLDRLQLAPLVSSTSTGFLDPQEVLRACHILPRYSLGRLYGLSDEGRVESKIAKDQDDWKEYYANRFVDRDMLMRYHWGHGVGHTYSHCDSPSEDCSATVVPPNDHVRPASSQLASVPDNGTLDIPPLEPHDPDETMGAGSEFQEADHPEVREDTLEDLEQEELAVADGNSDGEWPDREEEEIRDPDSEGE